MKFTVKSNSLDTAPKDGTAVILDYGCIPCSLIAAGYDGTNWISILPNGKEFKHPTYRIKGWWPIEFNQP